MFDSDNLFFRVDMFEFDVFPGCCDPAGLAKQYYIMNDAVLQIMLQKKNITS